MKKNSGGEHEVPSRALARTDELMNAYIVRARTERRSAPLQFSFAISIAVCESPEEALTAAQRKFPEWSEFMVIGKAPDSVIERRGLSIGEVKRIAWRA
jgi:hypothetical protein